MNKIKKKKKTIGFILLKALDNKKNEIIYLFIYFKINNETRNRKERNIF